MWHFDHAIWCQGMSADSISLQRVWVEVSLKDPFTIILAKWVLIQAFSLSLWNDRVRDAWSNALSWKWDACIFGPSDWWEASRCQGQVKQKWSMGDTRPKYLHRSRGSHDAILAHPRAIRAWLLRARWTIVGVGGLLVWGSMGPNSRNRGFRRLNDSRHRGFKRLNDSRHRGFRVRRT